MGVASTQLRYAMVTAYKSDLEFAIQMICQKRTTLAYQAQGAAENYPQLASQYHLLDKQLELEQKTLETQSKAVSTEVEALEKTLNDDMKSFKYSLTV
jgi:hypothetical protein